MKILPYSLAFLLSIFSLSSCYPEHQYKTEATSKTREDRFEATSASMAQSQKDGVFLTMCTITPGVMVHGSDFQFDVQEAFIEQRFSVGANTDKVKLLDSLAVQPKLVIIPRKHSQLTRMGIDASLALRAAPYTQAGETNDHIILLNLMGQQLHKPFALRLQVRNARGQYEDYNLTVHPRPVAQALEESFSSSLAQSRRDGVLLATCAVTPQSVASTDSFRLHIQEAFIEHRFVVGARTHEVQRLDSGHLRPRLILVATPDSRLGPAGAAWTLTLPGGGKLTGYQEAAKVLAFDLPAHDLHRPFTLQLRVRSSAGRYQTYALQVKPKVAPPQEEVATTEMYLEPTSALNQDGFEESFPVFNASAAAAHGAGMLLAPCRATPAATAVGSSFRLDIAEAFIEQHALRTAVTKRISLDTTNLIGPRLMLAYAATSHLGELGLDWDLRLQSDAHNLVYQVAQQPHVLIFRLAPDQVHKPLILCLTAKTQQGFFEERLIKIQPSAPEFN